MATIHLYLSEGAKIYSIGLKTGVETPTSVEDLIFTELTTNNEYYTLEYSEEGELANTYRIDPQESLNGSLHPLEPITKSGSFIFGSLESNTYFTDLQGFLFTITNVRSNDEIEEDHITFNYQLADDKNFLNFRGLVTYTDLFSKTFVLKSGDTMTGKLTVRSSVEEGSGTSASGNYSHAEGYNSIASKDYSHAEGYDTTASGDYGAHAEGCETTASGAKSHAEGLNTLAAAEGAHAEGRGCQATNLQAHAEGAGTTASAQAAHAEGAGTTASALSAHAENGNTIASGIYSHAEGTYSTASGKASHSEGCKTVASGENSHSEGFFTKASGKNSHAEGTIIGTEHILNGAKNTTTYTISGEVAIGQYILYNNPQSGINNKVCEILTTLYDSAQDLSTITVDTSLYSGKITDTPVLVFWPDSNLAGGESSHTEGGNTKSLGDYSHAEGYNTVASGSDSHAEGSWTIASGEHSHTEGAFIDINSGIRLVGEGGAVTYTIGSSMAPGIKVGDFIKKDSNTQIKIIDIGTDTITLEQTLSDTAIDDKMYAVRCLSVASGDYSHVEGSGTFASGQAAHAEGKQTIASGENSHAEGYGTTASNFYAHAEGRYTTALGINSHAEGYMTHAEGAISHAEGDHTKASGDYSHTEGQSTLTLGSKSHAEGHETIASGENSHAEGDRTVTFELGSHAEGIGSLALGVASHVEGGNSSAQTRTRNIISISNDRKVVVIQTEGVAEESFLGCSIYRDSSRAMVINEEPEILQDQSKNWTKRTLTFDKAIPETFSTNFSLYKLGNAAKGPGSHAEGWGTSAFGDNSHSEGLKTTTRANYSHTEGLYTEAHGDNQHVEGKYNIPDETSLHIVGNGTYNSLSNAHTLALDGTAWFAGDIYTGSTSGTNKDSGSKKLATEEYVRNLLQEFATLNNLNMPD